MSGSEPALRIDALTVMYGAARGIEGVSLDVAAGQVTGLLGPNGAGKTTLLRAALDLVHPTSGSVQIMGVASTEPRSRANVTYLPGDLVLPGRLTGWAALRRYLAARGPIDADWIEQLANRLELDLSRQVGQLSRGNRQKIGLILAFAPQPKLLLLDEPTSGLDPLLQREFGVLVREAVAGGAGVVLSSHVLSELEGLADRVAVVRDGFLVAVESIEDLRSRAQSTIRLHFGSEDEAQRFAQAVPHVHIEHDHDRVSVTFTGDVDPIIKAAARFHVRNVESMSGELDDIFLGFYTAQDPS